MNDEYEISAPSALDLGRLAPRPNLLDANEVHRRIIHLPPGHRVTRLEAMIRETSDIAVDKERFGHVDQRARDHRHDECWETVQCESASGYTTRSRREVALDIPKKIGRFSSSRAARLAEKDGR
jgi:hypothetical protein